MLKKLTSRGPTAEDRAKENSNTLREVMHANAVGVAALATRVAELEAELKKTKAVLAAAPKAAAPMATVAAPTAAPAAAAPRRLPTREDGESNSKSGTMTVTGARAGVPCAP